jgi:hypothetical protein
MNNGVSLDNVSPIGYNSNITTTKGTNMMYPMDTLAEMAKANGFDVTPELLTLLNKSYELGVEDTY